MPLRPFAAIALAATLAGCHLVFPHRPGGDDSRADTRSLDGRRDHARADLPLSQEAGGEPACAGSLSPGTLALYSFEDQQALGHDTTTKHSFSMQVGAITQSPGRCGLGLRIEPQSGAPSYVVIAHHSDWDSVKAVDFWVRFDRESPPYAEGILSRDAAYTDEPGHFTLLRDCDGRIVVRLQQTGALPERRICSGRVVGAGTWARIVVSFHPLELRVDGDSSLSGGSSCAFYVPTCELGASVNLGIEGNHNPWVVGASNVLSPQGLTTLAQDGMEGMIDELRFSSVAR